jgi:hypothetical protein
MYVEVRTMRPTLVMTALLVFTVPAGACHVEIS